MLNPVALPRGLLFGPPSLRPGLPPSALPPPIDMPPNFGFGAAVPAPAPAPAPEAAPPLFKKHMVPSTHAFTPMVARPLERMALVCDFCAGDVPRGANYWHCSTCHETHDFERAGGCDICATCYEGRQYLQGALTTAELLRRRGLPAQVLVRVRDGVRLRGWGRGCRGRRRWCRWLRA